MDRTVQNLSKIRKSKISSNKLVFNRDDINGAVNLPVSVDIGIYQIGTNILQTTVTLSLNNATGSLVPVGDSCYTPDSSIL